MLEELLKAVPVFLFSAVKFILGPTLGFAARLYFLTTMLCTMGGMMAVVVTFTYFGEWLRTNVFNRIFTRKKETAEVKPGRYTQYIKKYGLAGVALFTPLFLTPLGGTLLALSTGSSKERIIFYMFVSASFWSLAFTSIVYFFGREFLPEFVK